MGFTGEIVGFEVPAGKNGLEEYPFRRSNVGDRIDMGLRKDDEHTLAGIFFRIRMFDIVEKSAAFDRGDDVLKTDVPLRVGLELPVFLGAP